MVNKKPINIHNGLASLIEDNKTIINGTNLIAIKVYQNSKNITKPFVKPISKIY